MTKRTLRFTTSYLLVSMLLLTGCGASATDSGYHPNSGGTVAATGTTAAVTDSSTGTSTADITDETSATGKPKIKNEKGTRDNTPECLVPLADGIKETHNDVATIDYSHAEDGYIGVAYTGTIKKIKLRITGSDEVTYTYDVFGNDFEYFPLTGGNGDYDVTIYENIEGTSYSVCLYEKVTASKIDEFTPFLYPNQYVDFTDKSKAVSKGSELVFSANNDMEAISAIYDFITSSISYDREFAETSPTGYVCDVDKALATGKGICIDYAALMATMLRSQRIPTRMEIGYAGDAYHAWISVYTKENGWLNGIIQFDGSKWTLVDPTFGASTDKNALKKFIGDGNNYTLMYMY